MEPLWIIEPTFFQHPFTCLIAGPQQSGKTSLVKNILSFNNVLIHPQPERIVFCFSVWQPVFDDLKNQISNIEFSQGLINIDQFDQSSKTLLILDDLMSECESDKSIMTLFTIDSHHKNISVFLLAHNLFSKGKYTRTISLNCSYLIVFKNPRDKSQIFALARQMFPDKINFLMEAFSDAIDNKGHSYLFIDLKQHTPERNRIQTSILPADLRIIYTPK